MSGAVPLSGLAPGGGARIRSIEVFPVGYRVRGRFKFLGPERPAVFVKVTCEDGAAGWGQSVPVPTWSYETVESVVSTLERYVAPALIGHEAGDLAGAHARMNKAISPMFSTGMPLAKAGVDLALHDLAGRREGRSIAALWGRTAAERIPLSWTINPATLAETERLVQEGAERGYRHFNTKVAPDPAFDVEMCRRVRKLAPKAFLWADANGGYDLKTALAAAPRLAGVGVNVLEQPVAANRLTGFREVRGLKALPIILDEGVVSSVELEEYIRLELADGAAMKPGRTAGLWDARRQVELLERYKLMFLGSGICDPDLSLAAALQLYAAYGLKYPAALNGPQFLEGSFLKEPILVRDGAAETPRGPGLGVEVDEERVRRASGGKRATVSVPAGFAWREATSTAIELSEDGRPVFAYNYGMQLKPGAPANFMRSGYLHPVYTPEGVVVSDDFPRDHWHHRGISWMWPVVRVDGQEHDLWACKGIYSKFVQWVAREAGPGRARLAVENGWFTAERKVMRELVEVTVAPRQGQRRAFDVALTFEAIGSEVEVAGTQDANKGYGGLSFRFAPREQTAITTDRGKEAKDTDMVPHPWAELEGTFGGRRAAARVIIDAGHPAYPNGWCLRHYGFLGVNYPGLKPVTFEAGKPVVLRYRVEVRDA